MRRLLLLLTVIAVLAVTASSAAAQTPEPTTPAPTAGGGIADHVSGPDNAFLTIVMYGDFQCVPCLDVARTLVILRGRYPTDVRIMWRHFVQANDDKASLAAQASEAASAQGKFWEMHDQLLISQSEWLNLTVNQFRAKLTEFAQKVGVPDLTAFNTALDKQTYAPLVAQATQQALDLGFKGVPVLLFKGVPYSGRIDEYTLDGQTRLRLLEKRWYKRQPAMQIDLSKSYAATLVMEKGNIIIDLYTKAAPVTVNNFIALARDGWYDNSTFHLVIPNQIAQTGDPSGTGLGTAGYTIIDEHDNGLSFDREGVVAMASQRSQANSGSSQFFITYGPLRPAGDYDGQFTIFGQVTQGMDILRQLTPRDPFDELRFPNPLPGDKLMSVKITEGN